MSKVCCLFLGFKLSTILHSITYFLLNLLQDCSLRLLKENLDTVDLSLDCPLTDTQLPQFQLPQFPSQPAILTNLLMHSSSSFFKCLVIVECWRTMYSFPSHIYQTMHFKQYPYHHDINKAFKYSHASEECFSLDF